VPGWPPEPGAIRRSIDDPGAAFERLIETFSVSEFLGYCTPSVPDPERAWAKKKGLPASQAKESLKSGNGLRSPCGAVSCNSQ
jgi:hypothetical protein